MILLVIGAVAVLLIGRSVEHEHDIGETRRLAVLVLCCTKANATCRSDGTVFVPKAEARRTAAGVDEREKEGFAGRIGDGALGGWPAAVRVGAEHEVVAGHL